MRRTRLMNGRSVRAASWAELGMKYVDDERGVSGEIDSRSLFVEASDLKPATAPCNS